ncbi:MAG TPA: pitrilysin family protein [Jatrophihabitans sp.]|jgi:predicted Zn-dependent peptidase
MPEVSTAATPRIPWHEFHLDNGLRLIVSPDDTAPIAATSLWYQVGSRDELAGQHGFAHLFEHLMFEGTAHTAAGEHFAALHAVGANNVNATTDFERTNYFQTVPVEHLDLALWLEAARMDALALNQDRLDTQRAVVANERGQRNDSQPYGDWMEQLLLLAFPDGHPYQHTTIGSMEQLTAAQLSDVAHFHDTYYAPNNAVLTIVGDVDPEQARDQVDKYFGSVPARPAPPTTPSGALPAHFSDDTGPVGRVELTRDVPDPRFYLAYRIPPAGSREHEVLSVLGYVLGAGRGSRLHRALVGTTSPGPASGAGVSPWELTGSSPSLFVGTATARNGKAIDEIERSYRDVLAGVLRDGVTAEELEVAQAQIGSRWVNQLVPMAGRAELFNSYATKFGDPEKVNYQLSRLLSVSGDEIVAVAREYLQPEHCRVLTYRSQSKAEGKAA